MKLAMFRYVTDVPESWKISYAIPAPAPLPAADQNMLPIPSVVNCWPGNPSLTGRVYVVLVVSVGS